ncbi:hypothetical protein AVEN_260223-1 [Araneus ventricosus]|uniref:Uncharacterized protein n=1 Tax=Araneus ventricosus TaxID=182803 RepID=A0A4Y2TSX1_ARAVE|nr:hypothetical protein AVEN_226733-1 [Araneus ventricosus]GBO03736.1 hypothetical protein AVEN_260223-1 [Araneus ventricosus]
MEEETDDCTEFQQKTMLPKPDSQTEDISPGKCLEIQTALRLTKVDDIVTKIVLWVYGVKSPTRRIMENEGLFSKTGKTHSTGNRNNNSSTD